MKPSYRLIKRTELDLLLSFVWAESPQGHDYWFKVFTNLQDIRLSIPEEDRDDLHPEQSSKD